ncbi:hypothetical protein NDU88_002048 [Pleurodeles waltl]|uniref:Uncharacterized protein n=1 Tax=Pleurodeles waltl TaxID=8319 RepID=A0AAV7S948_PLEWA|nr:hypothetical protein NDU88_002048 [Pleurodeles waltl]
MQDEVTGAAFIRWAVRGNFCHTTGTVAGSRAALFRLGYASIQWAVRRSSGRNAGTESIPSQGARLCHSGSA